MQLQNSEVIITVGPGEALEGLGGAALRRVVREGANATLIGPDAAAGRALVASIGAGADFVTAAPADVGGAIATVAEKRGALHALVNIVQPTSAWQAFGARGTAGFGSAFDALKTTIAAMQAAYPYLIRQGERARIVNVGSVYGSTAFVHVADSVMCDYALQGLTRSAGVEWAASGLRVNYLGPGALDVPEFRRWRERHPDAVDRRVHGLAGRRLGDPVEDFGGALMLLLSDEGCFLVGLSVHADGGQHLVAPVLDPGVALD